MSPKALLKSSLVNGLLLAECALRAAPATDAESLRGVRRFLLLQSGTALGTAVHATPLLEALRQAIPEARVLVAAHGLSYEIFRSNPNVDTVLATPDPLRQPMACAACIRRSGFFSDREPWAMLATTGNARTGIAITAMLSGATLRAGFSVAPELMHLPLHFDAALSQIDNNLRLLTLLGHTAVRCEPKVFFTPQELEQARDLLAMSIPGWTAENDVPMAVFITQTSPTQWKIWRAERFVAAAAHMARRHGAQIIFLGSAKEAAAIESIRKQLAEEHGVKSASLAGKTTLPVLAAVMAQADIGLTLDTGNLHMGRSVGLPMAIVAPGWSPPVEWLPLDNPRYRILKNSEMDTMPEGYIVDEVSVEEVCAALDALLAAYPASAAGRRERVLSRLAACATAAS